MKKKIYIDCTFTYHSGLNTGIQRVVKKILSRADLAKQSYDYEMQPVVCILGQFYDIPASQALHKKSILAKIGNNGKIFVSSLNSSKIGREIGLWGLLNVFSRSLFKVLKFIRMIWLAFRFRACKSKFEANSIFIFADLFWCYDIRKAFKKSDSGVKSVATIIYDLIPIRFPSLVESQDKIKFTKAFPDLVQLSNHFICISETVANDLASYLKEKNYRYKSVNSFRLGHDFVSYDVGGEVTQKVKDSFVNCRAWLTVGTLEPRKNHKFILDAFELLWGAGSEDVLIIVGRIGWMCEELLMRIESHPEFNVKLYFFSSLNDKDLAYCYKNARGLIFASLAEGFGLPLVEAMSFGLPVLCSDIKVFREIGGGYPEYFSLEAPVDLANAISSLGNLKKIPPSWPSWDESLSEFFSVVSKQCI